MRLDFARLRPDAVLPTRAYEGDAGLDLYSVEDGELAPAPAVTPMQSSAVWQDWS